MRENSSGSAVFEILRPLLLISNLCYQAIKEVYLIKCLVSVYKCVLLTYGIFTDPHDKNVYCRYLKCRKRLNYSLSYMEVLCRDGYR